VIGSIVPIGRTENGALLDLDNAVGSGFRNDASGTFNNNGTLMVDNVSAGGGDLGFGFSMSSSTNNYGSILIGTDGGNIESSFRGGFFFYQAWKLRQCRLWSNDRGGNFFYQYQCNNK